RLLGDPGVRDERSVRRSIQPRRRAGDLRQGLRPLVAAPRHRRADPRAPRTRARRQPHRVHCGTRHVSDESEMPTLLGRWLGTRPFASCLEEQLRTREAVADGTAPETLFMVEHPPTLTLGRRASREDVLWTDEQLAAEQVEVCETPRGGEVTLHAPGQLVAYPV